MPLVLAQGTTENRLAPSSLQVFIDNHEIPPEPPLLLAKQSQLSQPLLIADVLQSLCHLCGPSFGSIQYVHVSLVLVSLALDTMSQLLPLQC